MGFLEHGYGMLCQHSLESHAVIFSDHMTDHMVLNLLDIFYKIVLLVS